MAKSQNFTFTPRARWSELNKPFAIFYSDSHSNFLNKQANAFAVPFCFARHGLLSKSVCKDDNTAFYIAVFKRSLGPFQAATLDAALARNRAGFAVLSRPGGRPESPILLDHTCLCDTWTFFYLQEKSSSGGCLGTQPVAMTSMRQANLRRWSFPRAVLCRDQQISADQPSLCGTVQPDCL